MSRFYALIAVRLIPALLAALLLNSIASADPAIETRKRLLENQRNVYRLRREQETLHAELTAAERKQQRGDNSEALALKLDDLRDSIATGDIIIDNINGTISRQNLLLSTLERATVPSTLDMALNRALNANLSELAKKLAGNKEARKEVAHLRALIKQQAGLGVHPVETSSSESYAAEQQLAEDEFLRLLDLFSNGTDEQTDDKPIKITGIDDNTPYSQDSFLSYLGNSQYHLETVLHSGKMTFTVDGRPWHMQVAPEQDNNTYVIIYDISKPEKPRLVMFNKNLL